MRHSVIQALTIHICVIFALLTCGVASADDVPALQLVVLGSGGPGAVGRAGASYVVIVDGTPRILVDAGPGSFARLGESGLDISQIDTVLLTHLHVDHTGELPGIVKARAVAVRDDMRFDIYGPAGAAAHGDNAWFPSTSRFIELLFGRRGAYSYLSDFAGHIRYVAHDFARTEKITTLIDKPEYRISAISGHHRDAPSVIYRIDHGGQSITFSGDIDAHGHAALTRIAQDSTLLVFNCVLLDPPDSPQILYSLHSAPHDIGAIAAKAGVRELLLSHLNPSIDENQASVRASIAATFKGEIVFASDGTRIPPTTITKP